MSSIIRIKRKWNEDPAQAILISSKKPKLNSEGQSLDENFSQNVLSLVGTVKSLHDENSIKYAIERSEKEGIKTIDKNSEILTKKLKQKSQDVSKAEKYKLVTSARKRSSKVEPDAVESNNKKIHLDMCNLYDAIDTGLSGQSVTSETITINGVPTTRTKLTKVDDDKDSYVYDLYYCDDGDFDDRNFENCVSIMPFSYDELVWDEYRDANSADEECEDDDDSNDEYNWRNDYPDEDYEECSDGSYNDGEDDSFARMTGKIDLQDCSSNDEDGNSGDECMRHHGSYEKWKKKILKENIV